MNTAFDFGTLMRIYMWPSKYFMIYWLLRLRLRLIRTDATAISACDIMGAAVGLFNAISVFDRPSRQAFSDSATSWLP